MGRHSRFSVPGRSALLIALASLAGCARPLVFDGSLAAVPFETRASGRIVIGVELNGRGPYRFAVDTAATGSFLFSRVREDLGLDPIPGTLATVHGAVASGTFPVVEVDRLAIGRADWANARLIALPGDTGATATIDGILGADFLRRYSVGFSAREKILRLYAPETIGARSYRGWRAIPIEPEYIGESQEPLHFLGLTVEGRSVPALFDLGAGTSVLSPAAARALRLAAVRPEQAGQFSGAVGNEPVVVQLSSQPVSTGGVEWRNETFVIADLPIFDTLRSVGGALAVLGSGLFHQRDFVIDFARNRLLVRGGMTELEE
jgi:predicted aspartyl protease